MNKETSNKKQYKNKQPEEAWIPCESSNNKQYISI